MADTVYNLQDYETYIEMSHDKHILVEGTDDENFFKIVLDELKHHMNFNALININIDTAEDLRSEVTYSNRKKVEIICENIAGKPYEDTLIGFVDRDFCQFEIENEISDKLRKHRIKDRLIWTRGHSIENYYFDALLLRKAFRIHSEITYFEEIYDLFKMLFPSALYLACSLGLAAKELGMLKLIDNNNFFQYEYLNIENSEITIDFDPWLRQFAGSPERLSKGQELVQRCLFWRDKVKATKETECIKWLCHGHIGFRTIWTLYEYCMYHIYKDKNVSKGEAKAKIQLMCRRSDYSHRLYSCFHHNIDFLLSYIDESPLITLKLINLNI